VLTPMALFSDPEIYRSILESLPVGLCVIDQGKRIALWSDGAARITGHLRHEVIGHSSAGEAMLHCDQPNCEWCNENCVVVRAIKTAQPAEAFSFVHHKAGHEVAVRAWAVPVHNAHGSIIGVVEIFAEQPQSADRDQDTDLANLPGSVDEITSVAHCALMRSHLRETLGKFTDVRVPFALLLFRVEGLAEFRTNSSADAAASLLRMVARTLEGALWRGHFVGRWSSDQFLVILNGCRKEALQFVRERVSRMLASDGIEWWGEKRSLPISVGEATAQTGDTIESLMERLQKSVEASATARRSAAAAAGSNQSAKVKAE
jgi:PAS domain S-box-containing protein